MQNVVVDTNVLLSGLFWKGTPQRIVDLLRIDQTIRLIFSPETLAEFHRKLTMKFKFTTVEADQLVQKLSQNAVLVHPVSTTTICRDPKDNMVLDTAKAGKAAAMVSGDGDLQTLRSFDGIPIFSPRAFVDLMK